MQIEIPKDAEQIARGQAAAAGFGSVDEYVANLIRSRASKPKLTQQEALANLRKLREETPKMSNQEIVDMVSEARAELP